MSEQEKQLIKKIADFILVKTMNSRTNEVEYGTVAKFMNVPIEKVRTAAIRVCQYLINNANVEDVDIQDGCIFDVMLKRRTV